MSTPCMTRGRRAPCRASRSPSTSECPPGSWTRLPSAAAPMSFTPPTPPPTSPRARRTWRCSPTGPRDIPTGGPLKRPSGRATRTTRASSPPGPGRVPRGRGGGTDPQPAWNMEQPYGLTLIGNYALVARRHMAQYGTTPQQLAEIAITTRRHAMRNPQAVAGLSDIGISDVREITIDDVLGSRLVADPLHLLECCIVSDGGGAVVIVSRAVAAGIRSRRVDPGCRAGAGLPGRRRRHHHHRRGELGPGSIRRGGCPARRDRHRDDL